MWLWNIGVIFFKGFLRIKWNRVKGGWRFKNKSRGFWRGYGESFFLVIIWNVGGFIFLLVLEKYFVYFKSFFFYFNCYGMLIILVGAREVFRGVFDGGNFGVLWGLVYVFIIVFKRNKDLKVILVLVDIWFIISMGGVFFFCGRY